MRILIDMDDTIADLQGRLLDIYNQNYPDKPLNPQDRKEFYWGIGLGEEIASELWHIMRGSGFYLSLDPIKGAIDAVRWLEARHEVYLVTSAGSTMPLSPSEKYQWVEEHFGSDMVRRLVITRSKHIIKGDILIDDKPSHENENQAEWKHILYDQPYNRNVEKDRLNWQNYQEVLSSL